MSTSLILPTDIDLTAECASFPDPPEREILRTEFLESIDDVLRGDTQVLILEGPDGIGKTTLCAQFARRHRASAFSLFVRPSSRMCADAGYLHHDLCCQVHLALTKETFLGDSFPENYLATKLPVLQRLGRKIRRPVLFVVDGLSELTGSDLPTRQYVLQELLQIGAPGFRFVLTGDAGSLLPFMRQVPNYRQQIILGLPRRDVGTYLEDLPIPGHLLSELEGICKGNIGRLTQVRRMLTSGLSPDSLAERIQGALPDLFRVEWEPVRALGPAAKLLLATIATDRFPRTVVGLAEIVRTSPDEVSDIIRNLSFLTVDSNTKVVSYASESFRRFAGDQLRALEPQALSAIIDKLLEDDASEASLLALPSYLERVGRFEQLITVLDAQHIAKLATQSGSLRVISDRVRLGLTTARRLHRHGDMTRFSIHSSVISEVRRADSWQAEVSAMVALDDYAAALELAENAFLKEDVLHLLATIAHAQVTKGQVPDPVIVEQVRSLSAQIDPVGLGQRTFEIASEIVSFAPDLAINFVERSADNSDKSSNALDAMYVGLTFSAISRPDARGDGAKIVEEVKAKIKGPEFKLLSTAVSVWALDYGVEEVIAEVEKLDKAEDRLFLLRHWASINASQSQALKVSDYGVRLAIQTTAFSTNAGLFRELATPLRFANDPQDAEILVKRISPQMGTLRLTGPAPEYVKLQMHLAVGESKYDRSAMADRVLEVYGFIREYKNLHIRAECTAALLDTLNTVDPAHHLENAINMHSTVASDLEDDLSALLEATADHHDAAKQVVRALATSRFDLALDITRRLNTQDRRDDVLNELINRMLELPESEIEISKLESALDLFSDRDMHDDNVLAIIERLAREERGGDDRSAQVCRMLERIREISGAAVKARTAALAFKILKKGVEEGDSRLQALEKWQIESWRKIDVGWQRINVGFTLSSLLADVAPKLARQYMDEIALLRREPTIDAYSPASAFIMSLRLAIRAWGGVLGEEVSIERRRRIGYLIDRLPSAGERAKLYSSLAVTAALSGRAALCREIVTERVDPLLSRIDDERYLRSVVVRCAPALYASHRGSALERIQRLPSDYQDTAYLHISYMILGKYDPADPYQYSVGQGYAADYRAVLDVLELAGLVDKDSLCYLLIERVADTVARSHTLSREQKADLPAKLLELITKKFPNPRFIKHNGYKLIGNAQRARLEPFVRALWQDLLKEAAAISNTADRAFVLTIIASLLPAKEGTWRDDVFEQARILVSELPASTDKIERYQEMAERVVEYNPKISRECLEAGVRVIVDDQSDNSERATAFIEIAYQIDPDFASSLAALLTDDPAKASISRSVKSAARAANERLETLKLSRGLGAQSHEEIKKNSKIPEAAWHKLGELNAGKATVRPYEMEDYTQLASQYPLSEAYPIMCWVIQNSVLRFKGTDQEASRLVPMLDATLLSAGLAQQLAARTVAQYRAAKEEPRFRESREFILVQPGERERAFDFIRGWIQSHVHDYLKICDPFFGLADLEVLKLIKESRPDCTVQVMTSRKEQGQRGSNVTLQEAYQQYLRTHVLSDDPPPSEIVVVGVGSSGESPIHDRWWLASGSGLRFGTSFNSLGLSKESEISVVAESEAAALESRIDEYLTKRRREFRNERVSYDIVIL